MTVALNPQPLGDASRALLLGHPPAARSRGTRWGGRIGERLVVDGIAPVVGAIAAVVIAPSGTSAAASTGMTGALILTWLVLVASSGSYRDRLVEADSVDVRRILSCGVRLTVVTAAAAWWLLPTLPRTAAVAAVATTVGASTVHRLGAASSARRKRRRGRESGRRVLAVGHDAAVRLLQGELDRLTPGHVDVVGTCPPDPELVPTRAEALDVDGVIVLPCHHLTTVDTRRLSWSLAKANRQLLLYPGLSGVDRKRASVTALAELPLLHVRHTELTSVRRTLARLAGRSTAAVALVVLSPLLALLAVAIRLDSPGPAFFRQTRVGQHEVPFTMLKFRTMGTDAAAYREELTASNEYDGVLFKIRLDPRVTRLGRFLRRYSLDELPQLVNVVRGEMALVGPRPPLPEEVAQYAEDVRRRFAVAPGITGLWQVSGRSDLDWEESVRLDLSYVDNWSPMLDAGILARTATAVFCHRGAY